MGDRELRATATPDGITALIELLEQPRAWSGLPGYGDAVTWRADRITVGMRVDDDGLASWFVKQDD